MAKAFTFMIAGASYEAEPVKVERKKVYGYTEIRAYITRVLVAIDVSGSVDSFMLRIHAWYGQPHLQAGNCCNRSRTHHPPRMGEERVKRDRV